MSLSNYPIVEYEPGVYIRNYYFRLTFIDNVVKKNSMHFYPYVLNHGDTPESLSRKLYSNDRYWYMLLLVNNISEPFYEWILTDEECRNYANRLVDDKHPNLKGQAKKTKIEKIYTSLIKQYTGRTIMVPSADIITHLHDDFLQMVDSFK